MIDFITSFDKKRLGYLFVVFGVCIYAFSDAIMQYFMPKYGVNQVVFFRTLARIIPFIFVAGYQKFNPFRTTKVKENLIRAILASTSTYCFMYAYRYAALTDVTVISYSTGLLIIPLSMLVLHEKINKYNVIAVILGFSGILLAFRPGYGNFQIGSMFAVIATFVAATNHVIIKKLSSTENELTLIFYHHLILIIFSTILGFGNFTPIALSDLLVLFIGGLLGAISQYCMVHAFKLSTSSGLASATYFMLIPTTLIDYTLYGKVPDIFIVSGMILIISGAMLAYKMQPKFQ